VQAPLVVRSAQYPSQHGTSVEQGDAGAGGTVSSAHAALQ
jgi:hypothetical protein